MSDRLFCRLNYRNMFSLALKILSVIFILNILEHASYVFLYFKTYIHAHSHPHTHAHTHTHIYIYIYIYVYIYAHVLAQTQTRKRAHARARTHTHTQSSPKWIFKYTYTYTQPCKLAAAFGNAVAKAVVKWFHDGKHCRREISCFSRPLVRLIV